MRRLFISLVLALLLAGQAFGVVTSTTWHGDGGDNLWATVANWTDNEGGHTLPTSAIDAIFDATSENNCSVAAAANCKALNLTNYIYTLSLTTNTINIYGNLTLEGNGFATITASSGRLAVMGSLPTLKSDAYVLPVLLHIGNPATGGNTFTLSDAWTCTGGVIIQGPSASSRTINSSGADKSLNISGDFTISTITTASVTGTTEIVLNGGAGTTQTVSSSLTSGSFGLNLTVAANAGATVVFSGRFNFGHATATPTLTWTSGGATTTGSTLVFVGAAGKTIAGLEKTWNNVTVFGTGAVTLSTILNATGICSLRVNSTFAGTEGFTIGTLRSTAGLTHSFTSGETYTLTDSLALVGTSASPILLNASTPDTYAYLTLGAACKQNVRYVNPTDINSSLGLKVKDYYGVIDNSPNWKKYPLSPTGGGQAAWGRGSWGRTQSEWGR